MALKRGIVELEEFNEQWAEDYKKEEKILKEVLGDKLIEVHHIGSTSIPGLKAKPVIDILAVIPSLENINEVEELLKDYDYSNRGSQGVPDRMFFAKGPEDSRTHYVHFVEPGSKTYYNQIYFKRYLIEHPEYIKKYCELKQELAEKFADDRPKYTGGKNEFITDVLNKAKEEYDV